MSKSTFFVEPKHRDLLGICMSACERQRLTYTELGEFASVFQKACLYLLDDLRDQTPVRSPFQYGTADYYKLI